MRENRINSFIISIIIFIMSTTMYIAMELHVLNNSLPKFIRYQLIASTIIFVIIMSSSIILSILTVEYLENKNRPPN